MENKKKGMSARQMKILLILAVAVLVAVEVAYRVALKDVYLGDRIYNTAMRFVGGAVCVIFMLDFSFSTVMRPLGNRSLSAVVAMIPAFAVAVNNFPFVSFIAGDCSITVKPLELALYALFCLSVGFFEEMAFRGCVLMILLKNRTKSKGQIFLAIFLSSAVFGLIHLVNLFAASPGAVFLQIGYSALIGAMCSLVLLTTKNIWLCVILHAVYNFAGGVIPELGAGRIWTVPEVVLTAVLGVAVTAYSFWYFFSKMPVDKADELYEG